MDISWALFCVPRCMVLDLSPAPSTLFPSSLFPSSCTTAIFVMSCCCPSLCPSMSSSCGGSLLSCCGSPCCHVMVILLLIVSLCPLVVIVAVCPLVIDVIPFCCFCHHSSACFLLLHPPQLSCASCSFPPHKQLLFLQGPIRKFAKLLKQNWHQASINRQTQGTELDGFACLRKMASRLGLWIVWNLSIKLLSSIRAYHQSQTIWLNNLRVARVGRRWIYMWDMMSVL